MNLKNIKIYLIIVAILLCLAVCVVIVYPKIEFKKDGKLYVCSFSDDFSRFEENASYNELYFYNEKHDVSLKTFDVKNFLCFYLFTFEYEEGDKRETMFILDEEYIDYWLENAKITSNSENVDVAALIEGKEAIVANRRYHDNDYNKAIFYDLDGKSDEMYIFECDGLTVIQVGSPDESPKYIAYK